MSDETALLRAICAHPDEDTPRLAFADWLDEHGKPERAAFIRGQIELAQLKDDSPRRREVAYRCRELLDSHEKEWLDPRQFNADWAWSRGFVETFTINPLNGHAATALFETHPFRRVWVHGLPGGVDALRVIPTDNHLTALDLIGNNLNVNQLKKLAKMTHLSHLRELGLMFNALRDTAVKVLCGEAFFQRLELIRLGANPLTDRGRDQLRAHFGKRVTFEHDREPDRLYTIQNDYLRAGWGNDFTQIFVSGTERGPQLAIFDHAGNLLRVEERECQYPPGADYNARARVREEVCDRWLTELGYEPATIKVKRFQFADGTGLTPFNWWADTFDPTHAQHGEMTEAVARWLAAGQYRFAFGGSDAWFDRSGEVTDT